MRRCRGEGLEVLVGGELLLMGGMVEVVVGSLPCDAFLRTRGEVRRRGPVVMDDGCWSLQDEIGFPRWLASSLSLHLLPTRGVASMVVLLEVCLRAHERPLQQREELQLEEAHR